VPLDLFPRPAPLVLDLGCGNGAFMSALAARDSSFNFLGVEKKAYRVHQARRHCRGLENTQILAGEVTEVLRMLPPRSVARAFLLFSDPWPKRRHAVRRVVQGDFVELLASRLTAGGEFFFASDCPAYAVWASSVFATAKSWRVNPWMVPPDWPSTEFERRFTAGGVVVSRFHATSVLQLPHASD
jgi:tRNA (guanine-N7-)-methyltransferase